MSPSAPKAAPLALVTGAARRVGRALALHLARAGWDVLAHYHGAEAEAAGLRAEIEALGRRVWPLQADLARPGAAGDLIAQAVAAAGAPDLLVNNAALFAHDRAGAIDADGFERQMRLNALAPIELAETLARVADKDLLIVNMLDQKILGPSTQYFSYTLSKMALATATRLHATALGPHVRVNAIAPGVLLPDDAHQGARFEALARDNPLGRKVALDEICAVLDLIIAAPAMNGAIIPLDGGRHLQHSAPDPAKPDPKGDA